MSGSSFRPSLAQYPSGLFLELSHKFGTLTRLHRHCPNAAKRSPEAAQTKHDCHRQWPCLKRTSRTNHHWQPRPSSSAATSIAASGSPLGSNARPIRQRAAPHAPQSETLRSRRRHSAVGHGSTSSVGRGQSSGRKCHSGVTSTGPPDAAKLKFRKPERFSGESSGRSPDMS